MNASEINPPIIEKGLDIDEALFGVSNKLKIQSATPIPQLNN